MLKLIKTWPPRNAVRLCRAVTHLYVCSLDHSDSMPGTSCSPFTHLRTYMSSRAFFTEPTDFVVHIIIRFLDNMVKSVSNFCEVYTLLISIFY